MTHGPPFSGSVDNPASICSSGTRIIYGAPVFVPLLFADLAVLAAIGLWDVRAKMLEATQVEVRA